MRPRAIEIPNMSLWSQSIGGLIINFGQIEFQTLRWLELLGGEQAAVRARRDKLSQRIKAVLALVASSSLPAPSQERARQLWTEVGELSRTRNRIAHNPICVGHDSRTGESTLSVIDLQQMVPTGENALERLHHSDIASTALRVRDISRELLTLIESGS